MKKLSLFVLLIAAILASCSSDDDAPSGISEANLIGEWKFTAASENGTPETLDECDLQDVYEFKAGGSLVNTFYNSNVTIADGQTTIICEGPNTDEFSWSLSGDQLTFTYGDAVTEIETLTIVLLNSTTLTTEYTEEENGEVYVYTETYTKL